LWQAEDLSGNRPDATLENAKREGVADRVQLETGDMKAMPFANASFDVVVSRAAIHNIYDAAGRAKALSEIARVLAPGGHVIIDDIRHVDEYETALRSHGIAEIRRFGSPARSWLVAIVTLGSLRPGQLLARKPSSAT
jgi:ubiquinone/menaquinone biosynthesis C-methylase UbiE